MGQDYVDEIRAIARAAKLPEGVAAGAISGGTSSEEFRKLAYGYHTRECNPIDTCIRQTPTIGLRRVR